MCESELTSVGDVCDSKWDDTTAAAQYKLQCEVRIGWWIWVIGSFLTNSTVFNFGDMCLWDDKSCLFLWFVCCLVCDVLSTNQTMVKTVLGTSVSFGNHTVPSLFRNPIKNGRRCHVIISPLLQMKIMVTALHFSRKSPREKPDIFVDQVWRLDGYEIWWLARMLELQAGSRDMFVID